MRIGDVTVSSAILFSDVLVAVVVVVCISSLFLIRDALKHDYTGPPCQVTLHIKPKDSQPCSLLSL